MPRSETVLEIRCVTCKTSLTRDDPKSSIRPHVGNIARGHIDGYLALGEYHIIAVVVAAK